MSRTIPYDHSFQALLKPCADAISFSANDVAHDAALCMEMSRLVYCAFENDPAMVGAITDQLATVGFAAPHTFNAHGLQAFISVNATQQRGVLVFRGTQPDERADWVTDIQADLKPWAGPGLVHHGFAKNLAAVWHDIETVLLQYQDKQFLYTGHSLGAALATLAAALRAPAKLFTFGSPRVGNAAFADAMITVAHDRYVDCCDGVCKVPPKIASYRHVGVKKYFDRNGHLRSDPSSFDLIDDQAKAEAAYLLEIGAKVPFRHLADHAPINYIYALRAIA
jgi:triacylglycerol lipase